MTKTKNIDKGLEIIIIKLMIRAYDMGKKQLKNPYKYTLDTDSGEKEWKEIMQNFQSRLGELRRDFYKELIKEFKDSPYSSGHTKQFLKYLQDQFIPKE